MSQDKRPCETKTCFIKKNYGPIIHFGRYKETDRSFQKLSSFRQGNWSDEIHCISWSHHYFFLVITLDLSKVWTIFVFALITPTYSSFLIVAIIRDGKCLRNIVTWRSRIGLHTTLKQVDLFPIDFFSSLTWKFRSRTFETVRKYLNDVFFGDWPFICVINFKYLIFKETF